MGNSITCVSEPALNCPLESTFTFKGTTLGDLLSLVEESFLRYHHLTQWVNYCDSLINVCLGVFLIIFLNVLMKEQVYSEDRSLILSQTEAALKAQHRYKQLSQLKRRKSLSSVSSAALCFG